MNKDELKKRSKFLSLVLRHQPKLFGIELDAAGWVDVSDLLAGLKTKGQGSTKEQLEIVVNQNDKQRFEFDEQRQRIRARQGHSVSVSLGYEASEPPELLRHGAPTKFIASIRQQGLTKQKRHDVHLHQNEELAASVGQRRGKPVVLVVEAKRMHDAGHKFFLTENGVWLTDHVPAEFIRFGENDPSSPGENS